VADEKKPTDRHCLEGWFYFPTPPLFLLPPSLSPSYLSCLFFYMPLSLFLSLSLSLYTITTIQLQLGLFIYRVCNESSDGSKSLLFLLPSVSTSFFLLYGFASSRRLTRAFQLQASTFLFLFEYLHTCICISCFRSI